MLSNEKIKNIIETANKNGHTISVKDISFVLLNNIYADDKVAYKSVFTKKSNKSYEKYVKSPSIKYLKTLLRKEATSKSKNNGGYDEVSFEENKQGIVDLIKDTEAALVNKEISKKDGLKILADLRVKLTEKFNIQGEQIEQMVIVEPKFNAICKCGREIYIPTKEDMMKKYNLIENKQQTKG